MSEDNREDKGVIKMLKTFYEFEHFISAYELKEFLEKAKIKPKNIIMIGYAEGRWRLIYRKDRRCR